MISKQEQTFLLELARKSIEYYLEKLTVLELSDSEYNKLDKIGDNLQEGLGCFVTLKTKKSGDLRGCIGLIQASTPLYLNVMDYAVKAAVEDPRFPVVTRSELDNLLIEVSVMGPIMDLRDLKDIQVGTHGLIIRNGFCQGLLLPQVALEWKMDRTAFLEHTCTKAGLGKDAYKDEDTEILFFTAEVFEETN